MAALQQQLLQWGRATLAPPPCLGISRQSISDISRHDINIVHVRRQLSEGIQDALQGACQALLLAARKQHRRQPTYRIQTSLPVQQAEEAAQVAEGLVAQLLPGLQGTQAGAWLTQDIVSLAAEFEEAVPFNPDTGPQSSLNVRLEVLAGWTPCPRWHADHVTARLLVTYLGPGTLYVPNSHAKRKWSLGPGGQMNTGVGWVDESAAVQAQPGDVVVLKGHSWPGCLGLGAVHRSPGMPQAEEHEHHSHGSCCTVDDRLWSTRHRLLLTIDDAVQHGADCASN